MRHEEEEENSFPLRRKDAKSNTNSKLEMRNSKQIQMTKLRKISRRTFLGFRVLDFPDLRFIRAECLFRISIFGLRIFLACVPCASEVLRVLRVLRSARISLADLIF